MKKIRLWFKKYFNILTGKGKPSRKLVRGVKGSVTILLTVIMLPMLVFSFSVLDICKIFLARDVIGGATDIALRSAMPSYDDVLKDMYGIFASSNSDEELTENVMNYYAATLKSCGIEDDDMSVSLEFIQELFNTELDKEMEDNNNFLKVFPGGKIDGKQCAPITVSGVPESSVANPEVMRRQIVEYMKYRGPITLAAGLFEKINAFKDLPNQANVVDKQIDYEQTVSDLGNNVIRAYTLLKVYQYNNTILDGNKDENILTGLFALNEKTTIIDSFKMVFTDEYKLSALKADNKVFDYDYNNDKALYSINAYVSDIKKTAIYVTALHDYIPTLQSTNGKLETYTLNSSSQENYDFQGKMDEAYELLMNADKTTDMGKECEIILNDETETRLKSLGSAIGSSVAFPIYGDEYAETCNLLRDFMPMFVKNVDIKYQSEFSLKCKQFLSNYERLKEDDETVEDKYTELYDKITAAENTIIKYAKSYYDFAKADFDTAANGLSKLYDDMCAQIKIIDILLNTDNDDDNSLEGIFTQFEKAKKAAEDYKGAINGVNNESQKNSNMAVYESEAQDFNDLKRTDLEKIKNALSEQRKIYNEIKGAIESISFLNDAGGGHNVISPVNLNMFNNGADYRKYKDFNKYLSKIAIGQNYDFYYTVRSVEGTIGEIVSYSGVDAGKAANYSDWSGFFTKVTDNDSNPFYKKLEELSKPKAGNGATDDGKEMKKNITEKAKTNDEGKPSSDTDNVSGSIKNYGGGDSDSTGDAALNPYNVTKFADALDNSTLLATSNLSGSDDNKAMAKNTKSMLKSITNYLSNLGASLGDSILVTQYFTEQFSCYTTNMDGKGSRGTDATMMTGYKFCNDDNTPNVSWYGAEQEYILYGYDTPEKNLAAASASIYGIRFVLNLIYSFTDTEITSFTTSVATAAGGIFPLSIPLIKTALHIGLSLAESAYDLMLLKKGAEVPIYKTTDTWKCKGSNIVRDIAGEVIEQVGTKVVDAAADKVNDIINKSADQINNFATDKETEFKALVKEEKDKLKAQVKTDIILPLELAIQKCIINFGNASDIESKLNEAMKSACDSIAENMGLNGSIDSSNYLKTAEKQVLDYVKGKISGYASAVSGHIIDYIDLATGINLNEINDNIENMGNFSKKIEGLFNDAINEVGDAVEAVSENISEVLNDTLNELVEKAKSGVKIGADAAKDAISNVSNNIRGQGHINQEIVGKTGKTSAVSMIGMSYQDYLTLFMIISVATGDTPQLERAAQLMTVNIRMTTGNKNYDLNNACTIFKAESTASVRTVFYGAVFENGKLKMPDTSGKYSFKYISYLGY